jgi:hypothetical protein
LNDNFDQAYEEIVNIIINGKLPKNEDKINSKILKDILS